MSANIILVIVYTHFACILQTFNLGIPISSSIISCYQRCSHRAPSTSIPTAGFPMGPLLVPWVLHRKTGPRIQLWKPDLDSSMSWTVGLPLFLVWNERFFFLKTWGCYDVPEKNVDVEKHVEHVESTFRWVCSSIRSTTMLKHVMTCDQKTLAFHTFCLLPFWTLTHKNTFPEEMQVHEDGETVRHALLPHWFVNSDWRCKMLYGTNT